MAARPPWLRRRADAGASRRGGGFRFPLVMRRAKRAVTCCADWGLLDRERRSHDHIAPCFPAPLTSISTRRMLAQRALLSLLCRPPAVDVYDGNHEARRCRSDRDTRVDRI